jgi:hypothetical protein
MSAIQKLKAIAEAQPEKVWRRYEGESSMMTGDRMFYVEGAGSVGCWEHGALDRISVAYIEAACPAAVLELIAQTEEDAMHMRAFGEVMRSQAQQIEQLKAENERLQRFETAYKEFSDKTEWVRPNAAAHELGMHVADILKRCDDLTSHNQAQAEEIVRLRKDAARLDRLDRECEAYGTEVHEGNRWVLDGPFATVRDAIDAGMEQEQQS